MAREFFKNLPDTTTPLNAQRMNNFLNGEEAMGSIVVDDITCKNILPTTTNSWKQGTYNSTTGTISASTNRIILSDYLTVESNQTYTISLNSSGYAFMNGYMIAEDGTYIQAITLNNLTKGTFTTTNNCKKIMVGIKKTDDADITPSEIETIKPQLEKGSVATKYVERKEYDNSKIIKNEKTSSKIDTYSCTYINDLIFKPLRDVTDMNNIKTSGIFTLNATTNVPAGTAYYNVAVFYYDTNPNYAYMIATKLYDPNIYVRYKFETWQAWKKIVPTAI